MPWSTRDVDKHIKGLTPAEKKRWVAIANGVRKSCLKAGGNEKECDARAVRAANARAKSHQASVFDLALVLLSIGDYAPIRSAYSFEIAGIVREYLYTEGNPRVTRFQSLFKRAITEAFYPAFDQGLIDGGGEAPAQGDDLEWLNAKVAAEHGYAESLFQSLKELKKQSEEEGVGIFEGVPEARAEGYAKTLDGIYSEGKIRGAGNQMLTFGGKDGKESCGTCQKLNGQRHKASWWIGHDLVPYQGNANLDCGGWQCEHILFNDKGEVFRV
jgi:hypothetical protein